MEKNPYLKAILTEMFRYVGEEFSWEYVNRDNWFWLHEWDEATEQKFVNWFKVYLTKDSFYELTNKNRNPTSREREKLADEFLSNYGWKTKR